MKQNNPNDVMDIFEEQDQIPNKKKKKKEKTKKSNHKHVYDKKYVLKEEKANWLDSFNNTKGKKYFWIYKPCSICGKLDHSVLPDYVEEKLKEINNDDMERIFGTFILSERDLNCIKENFPEIEIRYLEK